MALKTREKCLIIIIINISINNNIYVILNFKRFQKYGFTILTFLSIYLLINYIVLNLVSISRLLILSMTLYKILYNLQIDLLFTSTSIKINQAQICPKNTLPWIYVFLEHPV